MNFARRGRSVESVDGEEERRLHDALLRRAQEAVEAAQRLVADAEVADVVAHLARGRLAARCAWCGRYRVGRRWVTIERALDADETARVSHGICPDCVAILRDTGMSV